MKGRFFAPVNLMQIEETIKMQKPYAGLVVSTTGLDSNEFLEHSPTRVVLTQYEYDEELKAYKTGLSFDFLVQAPQSAIDKAIDNVDNYDVFSNEGIDREAYLRGENVLSIPEFQDKFNEALTALQQDNTLLIANNISHVTHYLEKIGSAEKLTEMSENKTFIDQLRLTQEYFQKHDIKESSSSLETLRNSLMDVPKGSFVKDADKIKDFKNLDKDAFLKAYPDVTEKEYQITEKDLARREAKIIGGNNRINVMSAFITEYGREVGLLEAQWKTNYRESDIQYINDLSEKGKKKYQSGNLDDKLDILKEQGVLNYDDIMNGNSEYHKLMQAVNDKSNKGIIITHVATTGFEFGKKAPQITGQPIAFAAVVCKREENGEINFSIKPKGREVFISAPTRSIAKAEQLASKGGYDTFKEAGIDIDQYKAGRIIRKSDAKEVVDSDTAVKRINDFFEMHNPNDYPIVVMGGTNKNYPDRSFTQTALQNLGNFAVCDAPFIDFSQATKDYTLLVRENKTKDNTGVKRITENVLFGDKEVERFGLQDIAEARNVKAVPRTPSDRCLSVAYLIGELNKQVQELSPPVKEEKQEKATEKATAPKKSRNAWDKVSKTAPAPQKPATELSENEAFIEGNGYSNIAPVEAPVDEHEREKDNAINAHFMSIMGDQIEQSKGNLYSDKRNDSAPIVTADNVRQIGRSRIPHISEAFKDIQNPDVKPMEKPKADEPKSAFDKRRERVPRPEKTTPTRFAPPPSSPVERRPQSENSLDVSALLKVIEMQTAAMAKKDEIIAMQSETIASQHQILAQQTRQILDVMQGYNEVMQVVLQNQYASPEQRLDRDQNTVERIENIISNISEIGNTVTGKAKTHLSDANKALIAGQKELENHKENEKAKVS